LPGVPASFELRIGNSGSEPHFSYMLGNNRAILNAADKRKFVTVVYRFDQYRELPEKLELAALYAGH
jgi:hypothetical protein